MSHGGRDQVWNEKEKNKILRGRSVGPNKINNNSKRSWLVGLLY